MLNYRIVLHSLIMLLPLTCGLASTLQRAGCARLRSLVEASDAECVALFEVCIPLIHDMQCVVPCTGAATLAGGRCGASLCDAPTARRVCQPGGRRMQGLRRARRRGGRAARARAQPAEAVPSARLPICPSVHVLRARVCACVHVCICASVHLCICASVRVCVFACLHVRVHRCGLLELLCEAMARHPQQAALQADCVLLVAGAVCAVYTLCAACGKDVHYLSVLGLMCTDIEC